MLNLFQHLIARKKGDAEMKLLGLFILRSISTENGTPEVSNYILPSLRSPYGELRRVYPPLCREIRRLVRRSLDEGRKQIFFLSAFMMIANAFIPELTVLRHSGYATASARGFLRRRINSA